MREEFWNWFNESYVVGQTKRFAPQLKNTILLKACESRRMEVVFNELRKVINDETAYKAVCTLRYTDLLDACDKYTWAHVGSAAKRGLTLLHLPTCPTGGLIAMRSLFIHRQTKKPIELCDIEIGLGQFAEWKSKSSKSAWE